jgi:glutathione synthase/RimK-type ligase-like ATP-grasp enzyme
VSNRVGMADCIFATSADLPELDPDDQLAVDILRARGIETIAGVWTDPEVDWGCARLCVVRSTWDYPRRHAEFVAWFERVGRLTPVRNEPALMRWNSHKFYLRDLEERGISIVPTVWLRQGAALDVAATFAARGWNEGIIKPAYGAATLDVLRVGDSGATERAAQGHLDRLLRDGDALVQPYLRSVETYPERALIFIAGEYSHAVTKQPFQALLPAGEAGEAPAEATPQEVAFAQQTMRALDVVPLYARVDLVRDDANEICLIELELIEPSLFLAMDATAPARFAGAIERELSLLATAHKLAQ